MSEVKQAPALDAKKSSKTNERVRRTIRIELNLFEPTSDDYPEFFVPELLYKERQKAKKCQQVDEPKPMESSFESPFNNDTDDDDDVQQLTKKMNEKYGTGSAYEINDKAAGYDESDSFIDNTEAFDEMIVDDTPRGGFYINSGPLVFKKQDKTGSSATKKRQSIDTEDEGKVKKFRSEHKKNKKSKKEVEEGLKEKGKTMAIKDVLRLQRDNALKNRRIVSDEEDSEESESSGDTSEDSDVKIVEPTHSLPPGIPDSTLALISEFKNAVDKQEDDKLPEIRARVDSSSLPPETKAKIHSYLQHLIPSKPPTPTIQEVPKEPGLDLPLLD